jgi:hypothetical protein
MRLKQRAEQSSLWPGARPVSPPRWLDDGKVVLTCDGSGLSSSALCERLAPAGSWQRTLSESLAWSLTGLTGYAVSLRLRATKSGRSLLVPSMSERPTEGTEFGSWPSPKVSADRASAGAMTRDGHWSAPGLAQIVELADGVLPREVSSLSEIKSPAARALWPTARAEDSESAGAHVTRGTVETLTAAARQWPTASATPYGNNRGGAAGRVGPVRPSLEGAARLWPTATSGDSKASGTRTGTPKAESAASHPGTTLTDAANGLWATPQAQDCEQAGSPNRPALTAQARAGLLDEENHSIPGKPQDWRTPTAGLIEPKPPGTKLAGRTPSDPQVGLADQVLGEWPTPRSERRGAPDSHGRAPIRGSLSPAWVSQLMGLPTTWLAASPPVTAAKR